jgi:NETI protein
MKGHVENATIIVVIIEINLLGGLVILMKKTNSKKLTYEVQDHETISQCLERIQKEGYTPIRRTEKPIFQEKMDHDQVLYEPAGRQIIFEVRKME